MALPASTVAALDKLRAAVNSSSLSDDDRKRVNYAIEDLEPVLEDLAAQGVNTVTGNIPILGGILGGALKDGINATLEQIEAELVATKAAVASAQPSK